MQPINPGQQPQQTQQASQSQASNKVSEDQASNKVSEDQANDFSKRMEKKKDSKGKAESKEDQSLESLMAERRKSAKEALEGKSRDSSEGSGQQHNMAESMVQAKDALRSDSQVKSLQSVSGPKEVNEVINKLVDKIVVSSKDAIEGAEVRITLKDNILPGTEIRIQKVAGELQVTMNTSSADSHNFLAANEVSLVRNLNERFGEKIQVNINLSGEDGQPQDGRSREEYIGEEEQDDNESA